MKKNLVVGLTGNYGSGKTTVLEIFRRLGAYTINTDMLVRDILKRPDIIKRVSELLGNKVIKENGELDRKAIAEKIFHNPGLRMRLEDIIHPEVFDKIKSLISSIRDKKIVIIEIPVLFEKGYEDRFDRIITVYAEEEAIFERLRKSGLTYDDIKMRFNAQLPYHEKIRRSDYIIYNSGKEDLNGQVSNVFRKLNMDAEKISEEIMEEGYGDQKT